MVEAVECDHEDVHGLVNLVATAPNWYNLVEMLQSFRWRGTRASIDPAVRAHKLLRDLSHDITYPHDRAFDDLQNAIANEEIATTVFKFFLHACSVLQYNCTRDAFSMMMRFCERLSSRFSDHQLWKAHALSTMALALHLSDEDAMELVLELRRLNWKMSLAETVVTKPTDFRGLPSECSQLVHCGLAVQDVLELAKKLIAHYYATRAPYNRNYIYNYKFLERGLKLTEAALQHCGDGTTFDYGILTSIADAIDVGLPQELHHLAVSLLPLLVMQLSFNDVIHAFEAIIPNLEKSGQLGLLLCIFRSAIDVKWPRESDSFDMLAFKALGDFVKRLFTSNIAYIYPTEEEMVCLGVRRCYWENLQVVAISVNLYLLIIWKEVDGGSNHTGLRDRAEDVKGWLKPLLEQRVEIEPLLEIELEVTHRIIDYAMRVSDRPELVTERGLPPT